MDIMFKTSIRELGTSLLQAPFRLPLGCAHLIDTGGGAGGGATTSRLPGEGRAVHSSKIEGMGEPRIVDGNLASTVTAGSTSTLLGNQERVPATSEAAGYVNGRPTDGAATQTRLQGVEVPSSVSRGEGVASLRNADGGMPACLLKSHRASSAASGAEAAAGGSRRRLQG